MLKVARLLDRMFWQNITLPFSFEEKMIDYAKAHISTEQPAESQDSRIQITDGDQGRSPSAEETSRQGTQAADPGALLNRSAALPQKVRLKDSGQFRVVYANGKRFDGHLMTAFIRRNDLDHHRLGITASRKLSLKSVARNRAKRLLRETFRLSGSDLENLQANYDWVLNPKRVLLKAKLAAPLADFQEIVAKVGRSERVVSAEASE